ncbi:MAG: hypothetical protein KF696_02255 [Planctomycetes bacterium]|nr:hypothetical protein [Planctomycetota bacterium]MCW8134824.1 hypothetical protein [Planctomycetota bacterium]
MRILGCCLALAMLTGCVTHKDYYYRDFAVPREQAYDAMVSVLQSEGYMVTNVEENWVNDKPEIYLETDWNLYQTGNPYPGNDVRRRAYIKITTIYTDRKPGEFQPIDQDDADNLAKMKEDQQRKAKLDHTRVSIAVNREQRSDIKRPMEADWISQGSDNFEVMALMGRMEALFVEKSGGGNKPTPKAERLKEEQLRSGR